MRLKGEEEQRTVGDLWQETQGYSHLSSVVDGLRAKGRLCCYLGKPVLDQSLIVPNIILNTGSTIQIFNEEQHPYLLQVLYHCFQGIVIHLCVAEVPLRQIQVHLTKEAVPPKVIIVPHRDIKFLTLQSLHGNFKLQRGRAQNNFK